MDDDDDAEPASVGHVAAGGPTVLWVLLYIGVPFFRSPMQYGARIIRTPKGTPILENYPYFLRSAIYPRVSGHHAFNM